MNALCALTAGAAAASRRLELSGMPQGAVALAAAAAFLGAAALVLWLYRHERAAPGWMRWAACGMRLGVLALAALILLRPSAVPELERYRPGVLVVLADRSASMATVDRRLPDGLAAAWAKALGLSGPERVRSMSRHELLRAALGRGPQGLLARCGSRNDVSLMTFAERCSTVLALPRGARSQADVPLPRWEPTGAATDLAGAIRAAIEEARGLPPAGIVLLTDGRHNARGDPEAAAREAARAHMPVYAVGIGDPSVERNVSVLELMCDDHVLAGNPLALTVVLRASGLEGREVELLVRARPLRGGQGAVIARRTVRLGADGALQRVELEHTPPERGEVLYTARVRPLEEESRADDNAASRRVSVLDERLHVLLVAGAPSLEYRFLSALLQREPGVELSVWLQSKAPRAPGAGNVPLKAFPARREEVLSYDAVVLIDPDPRDFTARWVGYLDELVGRHGGGLVWVASLVHTAEFLSRPELSGVRTLLPVVVSGEAAAGPAQPVHAQSWPIELTAEGAAHQIMRVAQDEQANRAFWAKLPGLYWVYPAERAKPGATVLLRYRNPSYGGRLGEGAILAAVQPYGAGRTFFMGCDETWRWRAVGPEQYRRFWLRLLRYLVHGRLLGGRKLARITLDGSTYRPGQPVRIRARLLDAQYRPLSAESVRLDVERKGERVGPVTLRRVGGEEGLYEGVFYPAQPGDFDLLYQPPRGEAVRESFRVRSPQAELQRTSLARGELEKLARLSGGAYVPPGRIGELPALIPEAGETVVEPGEPVPLWDRAWLLAMMVALLAVEWTLRRRMGAL